MNTKMTNTEWTIAESEAMQLRAYELVAAKRAADDLFVVTRQQLEAAIKELERYEMRFNEAWAGRDAQEVQSFSNAPSDVLEWAVNDLQQRVRVAEQFVRVAVKCAKVGR